MSLRVLAMSVLATCASAAHWAVIVSGSSGYANYRHQADACHAYQVVKAKGIPEENIILMMYDDVAHSIWNPFRGKLFNKPDPHGPGVDVYAGCKIDYKGKAVTPQNFVGVLTGSGTGKVLKSNSEDKVFVYFADHGAVGLIAFPTGMELHKAELQQAFQTMHDKQMYKKLVFYLESCESGSMLQNMSIPGVYALSAASPSESSWGTYCGDEAVVHGRKIRSCLGDLFSVNWMEDSDAQDTTKETLDVQFETVHDKTQSKSQVMQWGDQSFKSDMVSEYIGSLNFQVQSSINQASSSSISTRDVDLHRLFTWYTSAISSDERIAAGKELQAEINQQVAVERAYLSLVDLLYPDNAQKQEQIWSQQSPPDQPKCELSVHAAIREHGSKTFDANSGFALQFHRVVVNICADFVSRGQEVGHILDAARRACSPHVVV